MLKKTFESQFQDVISVLGPDADYYRVTLKPQARRPVNPQSRRHRELDQKCTRLADFYLKSSPSQQKRLRSFSFGPSHNANRNWGTLRWYMRRMAVHILEDPKPVWLRRGLASAAIINTYIDLRDLVVSLVLLRTGAERVGIDHVPYFDAILKRSDPEIAEIFINARDHSPRNVRDILNHFGPPELKPIRKKRAK